MQRVRSAAVPALFLILLSLGACANPADNKPAAEVAAPQPEPAAPTAEARRFTLAEGSTIAFVGSKVTGSHDGGFREFDGEIHLVGDDPTASHVSVTIDAKSLWADNDRLTGHLKSPDFFDVETYPTAQFTSTEIRKADEGYLVTGNLDLHGVTKSIAFPAAIDVAGDTITVRAEFFVKRFDFGIVYPGKAEDLIRDEVVIRLDLKAMPAA